MNRFILKDAFQGFSCGQLKSAVFLGCLRTTLCTYTNGTEDVLETKQTKSLFVLARIPVFSQRLSWGGLSRVYGGQTDSGFILTFAVAALQFILSSRF